MKQPKESNQGASPLPKGKRKPGVPLFKMPPKTDGETATRDTTGQTDTSVKQMKQRLREVPKKSSGSKHDTVAFEEK